MKLDLPATMTAELSISGVDIGGLKAQMMLVLNP